MKKYIQLLVDNEDFANIDEYQQELSTNRNEVNQYLKWRLTGGVMNGETLPDGYINACKELLEAQ